MYLGYLLMNLLYFSKNVILLSWEMGLFFHQFFLKKRERCILLVRWHFFQKSIDQMPKLLVIIFKPFGYFAKAIAHACNSFIIYSFQPIVRPLFDPILALIWSLILMHFMLNLVELGSNYLPLLLIMPKIRWFFISEEIIRFR